MPARRRSTRTAQANIRRRVVAYVRVSSTQQAESGLSLAAQRERVTAYAALYGLDLVDIVEDAGASAKSLDRPGLNTALGMVESGAADGLLIVKLDRLSRSLKDWSTLIDRYFGERARKPASLFSVGDSIDTTSAAGRLVLNMLMSVAQWEREVISERTIAALEVKRTRGEKTGGSNPIGHRLADDGTHLAVDDAEAATLGRLLELRAAGESIRAIAEKLNDEGLRARGARWHATTVARVLARQTVGVES